jgi:hypothetical protein
MATTIHRNFMSQEDAEAAHGALLAAGFPANALKLAPHRARDQSTTVSAVDNIFNSLTPDDADRTDERRPRPVALLSVDALDDEQREQAESILQRHNAIDA